MKITRAAVRYRKTGELFSNFCHAMAYLDAWESPLGEVPACQFDEGFTLENGSFIDRCEARQVAEENGQLAFDSSPDIEVLSEEILL